MKLLYLLSFNSKYVVHHTGIGEGVGLAIALDLFLFNV